MTTGQGVTPTWLRQVATALSSRYGILVREGKNWAMDIDKGVLTYKSEHLLALDRDTCLGLLLHEVGHLHHSKNDWVEKSSLMKLPTAPITFSNVNAFEDVRINEVMSQSYQGSRELIDAMNELLAGDSVKSLLDMSNAVKNGINKRADYRIEEHAEITYISMLRLMGVISDSFLENYYDQRKVELVHEITEALANVKDAPTTQEVYDLVEREVWARLREYLPQPEPSNNPEGDGSSDDANGNGTGGTGSGASQSDEKKEEEKQESPASEKSVDTTDEKKEEGAESEGKGNSSGNEQKQDTSKASDSKSAPKPTQSADGSSLQDWKRELERKIQRAISRGRTNPDEDHKTSPFTSSERKVTVRDTYWDTYDVAKYLEESRKLQSQFANKFATLFRDNQYAREVARQRHGRLDKRSLHKFALGNARLFKRKLDISKKSYGVAFLQDVSGSMSMGNKERIIGSYHAMLAFSTTLQKLGIPYGMGFFGSHCIIGKHFAERKLNVEYASRAGATASGNTYPNKLIKELAGRELGKLDVEEKIAVILTDGEWDNYDELHKLKKQNPKMHIYVVALCIHNQWKENLERELLGTATLLSADEPTDIVQRYIEIARKHLL